MIIAGPEIILLGELIVPGEATIEALIAAGKYDYADEHITAANFPITRRGSRKLYLIHCKRFMTTQDIEAVVATISSLELAKIEDLLAVGAHPKQRELQQEFPTICLGSSAVVIDDDPYVPALFGWGGKRELELYHCGNGWDGRCRFLLVGKPA